MYIYICTYNESYGYILYIIYNICNIIYVTCIIHIMNVSIYIQGIIQTKMKVGIQFWVPNLGLSPKYD